MLRTLSMPAQASARRKSSATIVSEGPRAIQELIDWGVRFDRRKNEDTGELELDLGREGGHTKRRILHSKDTTGREIETKLLDAVEEAGNIDLLEHHFAIDLISTTKTGILPRRRAALAFTFSTKNQEKWKRCGRTG